MHAGSDGAPYGLYDRRPYGPFGLDERSIEVDGEQ
jgi:hypothetical protein